LDIYPINGKVVEVKRTSLWASVESKYGMVVAPRDIGEWIVELQPNETVTFEAYFSDSAVAALFGDVIPLGRFSRALWECVLFARNGREMGWGDIKGLLVIPAVAEAVKKTEEIQEMPILEKGRITFIRLIIPSIKKILFRLNESLYTINPDGTALTKLDEGRNPIWSPTGESIMYEKVVGHEGDIYRSEVVHVFIINPDGTGKIDLGETHIYNCKWSPDGKRILYQLTANRTIFVINSDGTGKVKLDKGTNFVWSPDREKIAYVNEYGNLCVINADGTGKIRLAPEVSTKYDPQWGAAGKRIAYVKYNPAGYPWYETHVINVDGTDDILLEGYTATHSPHLEPPAWWSSDGMAICYISPPKVYGEFYRLKLTYFNSEGKIMGNITLVVAREIGTFFGEEASWSPVGHKILYGIWGSSWYENVLGYHVVDVEAAQHLTPSESPEEKLIGPPLIQGRDIYLGDSTIEKFIWSPTGDKIAYWDKDANAFYVFDLVGAGRIELKGVEELRWSPDGRKIAYVYVEKFGKEILGYHIYIINADGAGKIEIKGQCPVWSPDGGKIAYIRDGIIYVSNADGTNEVMLSKGTNPLWSPAFKGK
jgi:Tol biopolymer transport system component